MYAPIAIFCYRRSIAPLVYSLKENGGFSSSILYIYSDGWKGEQDRRDVEAVRSEIKNIKGAKSINIIMSNQNKGLANSIIDGVSYVIEKHGTAIVLEDDLEVSPHFLKYMNTALQYYENDDRIWSISGYTPPLPCLDNYEKDVFLSPRASSWGWATWGDRWEKIDWDVKNFSFLKNNKEQINRFNAGGNDMYKMLELQIHQKIDSWAIRWCFSQFLNNAYSVHPRKSMVQNNGFFDNKGMHNSGSSQKWDVSLSDEEITIEDVDVNHSMLMDWKKYHDLSITTRIGYLLKKFGGYEFAKKTLQLLGLK